MCEGQELVYIQCIPIRSSSLLPRRLSPGLFFEHFEKTQGLPEKKLKAHSRQKTQESGVNLGFQPKNSRKIDFYGLIFRGLAGFWSLVLPNWPHFEQILHSFQVCITNHLKKTQGFCKKLKYSAKKTQPFGVKWLSKTPKSRSKNKPALADANFTLAIRLFIPSKMDIKNWLSNWLEFES